ncbi:MAG: hypothetical protein ACKO7W_11295 [Elainella sp.]
MAYERRLKRWAVVRLLPNFQPVDLARFYKFSDAEGYTQVLRRLDPGGRYEVANTRSTTAKSAALAETASALAS